MINFDELKINPPEGPLQVEKWNGLVDNMEKFHQPFVGFGTDAPEAKLHIVNKNETAHHINGGSSLIIGPTNQSHLRLGYDTNYSWIQSHRNEPLAINPLGNKVGIGTTSPTTGLHISGNGLEGLLKVERSGKSMVLNPNYGGKNQFAHVSTVSGSNMGLKLDTNERTRLTILTNGHIGINTTNPAQRLTIHATRPRIALAEGGGNAGVLEYYERTDQLRLQWWDQFGARYRRTMMALGNNGHVGIGTVSPISPLHVNGQFTLENGWFVMKQSANTANIKKLLDKLNNHQLVIGGAWDDEIYFYWKDGGGSKRYARIRGLSL